LYIPLIDLVVVQVRGGSDMDAITTEFRLVPLGCFLAATACLIFCEQQAAAQPPLEIGAAGPPLNLNAATEIFSLDTGYLGTAVAQSEHQSDGRMGSQGRSTPRRRFHFDKLVPYLICMAVGGGYLATGLTLQLKTYDGRVSENPFRYVNYGITEAIMVAAGAGLFGALIAGLVMSGGDIGYVLIAIPILVAPAVLYGIFGWRARNSVAHYYATTSVIASIPLVIGLLGTIVNIDF
jgi:hypothetical protein